MMCNAPSIHHYRVSLLRRRPLCVLSLRVFLSECRLNLHECLRVINVSLTKEETERKPERGLARRGNTNPLSEVSALMALSSAGEPTRSLLSKTQRKVNSRIINICLIFNYQNCHIATETSQTHLSSLKEKPLMFF